MLSRNRPDIDSTSLKAFQTTRNEIPSYRERRKGGQNENAERSGKELEDYKKDIERANPKSFQEV